MFGNVRVLFTESEIASRVSEMGAEITEYYRNSDLTIIVLTNGAVPFAADIMRKVDLPIFVDTLAVASYHADRRGEELEFRSTLKLDPRGRHILLVDEVLDSGKTLKRVMKYLLEKGALDVRTAVMVTKNISRSEDALQDADWVGFHCDNLYLVGYGLDSNELYRNLPFIGVLEN